MTSDRDRFLAGDTRKNGVTGDTGRITETFLQGPPGPPGPAGGTILWAHGVAWSAIKATLDTVLAGGGYAVVMLDDGHTGDPFVVNSAYNFDQVRFVGATSLYMNELHLVPPFVLQGSRLWCEDIDVTCFGTIWTQTGGRPSVDLYITNGGLVMDTTATGPGFILDAGASHSIGINKAGYVHSNSSHPTFALKQSATLGINLYSQSSIDQSALGFDSGATAATVGLAGDSSTFPLTGVTAGITVNAIVVGDAAQLPYSPTTPGNWAGSPPFQTKDALDRIAAALAALGHKP